MRETFWDRWFVAIMILGVIAFMAAVFVLFARREQSQTWHPVGTLVDIEASVPGTGSGFWDHGTSPIARVRTTQGVFLVEGGASGKIGDPVSESSLGRIQIGDRDELEEAKP